MGDSFFKELFVFYFFVVNQALGIVHEAGHGICYLLPCPTFLTVLAGTLFQWLFPLGVALYYRRRGNPLGYFIGLFLLGVSVDYAAWYLSTAPQGPYLPAAKSFLGVDALHDFHYLLGRLGLLSQASFLSGSLRILSFLLMVYGVFATLLYAFSDGGSARKAGRKRR
ncbi:hypothetical protein [Nitratifractor sp.]